MADNHHECLSSTPRFKEVTFFDCFHRTCSIFLSLARRTISLSALMHISRLPYAVMLILVKLGIVFRLFFCRGKGCDWDTSMLLRVMLFF